MSRIFKIITLFVLLIGVLLPASFNANEIHASRLSHESTNGSFDSDDNSREHFIAINSSSDNLTIEVAEEDKEDEEEIHVGIIPGKSRFSIVKSDVEVLRKNNSYLDIAFNRFDNHLFLFYSVFII